MRTARARARRTKVRSPAKATPNPKTIASRTEKIAQIPARAMISRVRITPSPAKTIQDPKKAIRSLVRTTPGRQKPVHGARHNLAYGNRRRDRLFLNASSGHLSSGSSFGSSRVHDSSRLPGFIALDDCLVSPPQRRINLREWREAY